VQSFCYASLRTPLAARRRLAIMQSPASAASLQRIPLSRRTTSSRRINRKMTMPILWPGCRSRLRIPYCVANSSRGCTFSQPSLLSKTIFEFRDIFLTGSAPQGARLFLFQSGDIFMKIQVLVLAFAALLFTALPVHAATANPCCDVSVCCDGGSCCQ
jgi:hypothetical protein